MDADAEQKFWSLIPAQRSYLPIEDWSLLGRQRLVETHESIIRLLLDESFTLFMDDGSLTLFGFQDVESAVEWCLHRFVHGELDPSRLSAASRTFQLFTQVHFWLAQKLGAVGFRSRMRMLHQASASRMSASSDSEAAVAGGTSSEGQASQRMDNLDASNTLTSFQGRLATTLASLREHTCAELVTWWLEGSFRLRRQWFGRQNSDWAGVPEIGTNLSKKQRSILRHDALFRFLCLWFRLERNRPQSIGLVAAFALCFAPCENRAPYRVPECTVVEKFRSLGLKGPREIAQARKIGMGELIELSIGLVRRWLVPVTPPKGPLAPTHPPAWDISPELSLLERLECSLAVASLSPTLLHVYSLLDSSELSRQLHALPSPYLEDT